MATISTTMTQERISGTGGVQLFIRSWRPASAARGVVAIVPGFNSHGGYYLWVAEQLTSRNLTVCAVDLRVRGLSEGERFYVESFADYASDVHTMVTLARARAPGVPVFLLGHSAGGVISTAYALDHQAELAGLICESLAFQVPAPDFALAVIKGLSHLAPRTHVLRLRNEDFSRDPDVVKLMNKDPLIANEVQPTKTVAEMVRADERLKKGFPRVTLPLLILHGTKDRATKPSGSRYFFERAGSSDKTLKLYEGHVHDLLNDVGREFVMRDVARWIEARIR